MKKVVGFGDVFGVIIYGFTRLSMVLNMFKDWLIDLQYIVYTQ